MQKDYAGDVVPFPRNIQSINSGGHALEIIDSFHKNRNFY